MKNFLFIILLLFGIILLVPEEEINDINKVMSEREAIMKEKSSDLDYTIEVLSNDMKGSNCLVPRRNIQNTYHAFKSRIPKNAFKIIQDIRLKGFDQSQKVSEYISNCQTINISTLLCRYASHVYALRKLII